MSTAAAMTAPSTKVCNASPMITSEAAVLCTWHSSSSWQCRQMTAFSSRKKLRMPAAIVIIARRAGSVASASGISASSATPTSVPTA